MKSFPKTIFVVYLVILLWLVLFKFSYDIVGVITTLNIQDLNLIPFAGNGRREMFENLMVFVPFGLFLSANMKRMTMWRKLGVIFSFSLSVELIQFAFSIGRADITDVIMNTAGGLLGLAIYKLGKKYVDEAKLDLLTSVIVAILLTIAILLRTVVFRVKY